VTGDSDALLAVITTLASNQIVPRQLRVDQGSLEDAFLELTGRDAGEEVRQP
jgi:ABC-2 type transport system ATP-binding protein